MVFRHVFCCVFFFARHRRDHSQTPLKDGGWTVELPNGVATVRFAGQPLDKPLWKTVPKCNIKRFPRGML